ncbi:MAG: polysaccharide export protein [Candidatus Aminicenantes bacterium]|nr:polysaccharide export protein [Candidatus Aminicenantes bacterium]MDH5705336.1 polysaccharide export protein [Candidatus Aminicenantes bacterium]
MKGKGFISTALLFLSLCSLWGQDRSAVEYKVGPKDLLDISVFGLEELNKTVRVSEEGKISLPLLGEVAVEGLTKAELEKKLSQLLEEKYLQNPQVTVFIKEYQSKRVFLLGAVEHPGPYELLGRTTLLQIISQAGGLKNEAGDEILVIRQLEDDRSKSIKISIDELILRGDTALNIPLEPNDIVSIPVDKAVFVYVFGQVNKPGALEVKRSNIPTLLQAIAQAGGFSERASKSGVLIKRIDKDGKEHQIKVNVRNIMKGKQKDIELKENDIVYVPEAIF